jgi:hypothetical protein
MASAQRNSPSTGLVYLIIGASLGIGLLLIEG